MYCFTVKLLASQPVPALVPATATVRLLTLTGTGLGLRKVRFRGCGARPGANGDVRFPLMAKGWDACTIN